MKRRDLLVGALSLAGCASQPHSAHSGLRVLSPHPGELGRRVAEAYLRRAEFMKYDVDPVHALHYAEAASAYGVSRLSVAAHDGALFSALQARYQRMLAADLPNTANHVDANVIGVWPLEMALRAPNEADSARGLALADVQWASVRPEDGLTTQARFWIDDLWMIGLLQLQAWRVSGDEKYLDRAALTAKVYLARLQEENGLFHHGPNAPFFWGRGNGWVAAGLTEILSALPDTHADYAPVRAGYLKIMAALKSCQAEDGMWRQLIDHPEAWKETSSTAMFGFAFAKGSNRGLLDHTFSEAAVRAWNALAAYVNEDGEVRDVCVGTGQSQDVNYYLNRPRVVGDLHGQAPVLWFAAALLEG